MTGVEVTVTVLVVLLVVLVFVVAVTLGHRRADAWDQHAATLPPRGVRASEAPLVRGLIRIADIEPPRPPALTRPAPSVATIRAALAAVDRLEDHR